MDQSLTPLAPLMWRRVVLVAVISLFCAGCETPGASADDSLSNQMLGDAPRGKASDDSPKKRGVLWYRMALERQRLEVRVRLLGPPPRTTFFLPGPWAGRDDFARDISINGARNADGPVTFTISRTEGRIDVASEDGDWVELAYTVDLHDRRTADLRFRPQIVDDMLFVYAPAILVLPSEGLTRQVRDIPIEVHLPADWNTLTTWPNVRTQPSRSDPGISVHGFVAADPTQLRDAYLAASPELEIKRAGLADGSTLEVGLAPGFGADRESLADMLTRIVDNYVGAFGSIGDVHVLARELDAASEPHSRGVGRRGGFVLEMPSGSRVRDHALLVAHEALHLWNGHLLTPAPDAERATRWFKEGVTHYMALKTLNELGMMDLDGVLAELEQSARFYARNPAAHSGRASDTDRARLPYDRGVLLALGIDALLMKHSAGDIDITAWLRTLLESHGRRGRGFSPTDLRRVLLDVAGPGDESLARFWDAQVASQEALEPTEIFALAGLHWLQRDGGESGRLLPLQRSDTPFRALFDGAQESKTEGTPK